MELFEPILNQMVFLFLFIVIGFVLARFSFLPDNSATVLSKLENIILVPALILNTFIYNCNTESLIKVWKLLVMCGAVMLVVIPLSLIFAKLLYKEQYLCKIATYGLTFSNFGFMGYAVVNAVFPEIFFEYTMFTLPLWFGIYLWGAPVLLIAGSSENGKKVPLQERLKAFVNPMVISMFVGILLGLTGWGLKFPKGVLDVIDVSADCMSPLAMILTGLAIGKSNLIKLLKSWRIYALSGIKTVLYPLLFIGVFALLPQNSFISPTFLKCATCFAAVPMGLNGIVIPAAYGRDTSDAAGMALVSHLFSVITIPLAFMLLEFAVL